MGYGTALTPILIIMRYQPAKVIPAVLISQLFTDIAACVFHHNSNNVNLRFKSSDFRIAVLMGLVSSVGVITAVLIAVKIPSWLLMLYIGFLVLSMGVMILVTINKPLRFSWRSIVGISLLASFNKGISGGGYGPLVMGTNTLRCKCEECDRHYGLCRGHNLFSRVYHLTYNR